MLINTPRTQIIKAIKLWIYKNYLPTQNIKSTDCDEFMRIVHTDEGYKVSVLDYMDLANELVTNENDCTFEDALKIQSRILQSINPTKGIK